MTDEEHKRLEPLYNAETQDIWRQSAEVAASDNTSLRKAGTALAEAALQVIREYDGTHRLALAVADWSKAVANEGGRAALAQSDAEPVAWYRQAKETLGVDIQWACPRPGAEWEPLFPAPPRPHASAGLIEAAEIAETIANSDEVEPWVERAVLRSFAKLLRARAADRSEK